MANDPRRLGPGDLVRLLNSTPLGEVISEGKLRRQRAKAGLRIGTAREIDLLRYVGWLVSVRHVKPIPDTANTYQTQLEETANGAAGLSRSWKQPKGHGQKLTSRQEALIAALLTESSYVAAAKKAGVGETTVYRWLHLPSFRAAYRKARRELIDAAIGRIQASSGQAVDALVTIANKGRRDSDRVRAAVALLDHACRGVDDTEPTPAMSMEETPMDTNSVVSTLSTRMRQLENAEMPIPEKSRLTAVLADCMLRALSVSEFETRLKSLESAMAGQGNDGLGGPDRKVSGP